MIVLQLLGPTGVGKTHWGQRLAASFPHVVFKDLDTEVAPDALTFFRMGGPERFLERSLDCLYALSEASEKYVVATGAGTLWSACYTRREQDLLAYTPVLALWAEAHWLWHHLHGTRQEQRSLEQIKRTEYSPQHKQLYAEVDCIDRTQMTEAQLLAALRQRVSI